ncbi:hypothetical protein DD237_004884 [Peronospora effusa]|uniref:HTH psq-type domain-containing protein n=2 Tax=Peronospora effusa TaxID=542832 RepID=A0A3R7W4T9_9STRA|nr:hypothetical protein DD237_004884 [Peronospora effusa]
MALSSSVCVRRYLSEPGEKEALRVLKEQLRHQKRITSDDVRLAVRNVASQGGAVSIPIDFPPSRWVLEFKRVHNFMQLNSFAFNAMAGSISNKEVWTPERLEMAKLRPVSAPVEPGSNSEKTTSASNSSSSNNSSSNSINIQDEQSSSLSTGVVQVTGRNDNNSDDGKEKRPSKESDRSLLHMQSKTAMAYADPRPSSTNEVQRQKQLQHNFSQRHQQQLQQQQRRAKIVDERRRTMVWPRESARGSKEKRLGASRNGWSNENSTNAGRGDTRSSGNDVGPNGGRDISSMLPQIQQLVTNNGSSMDEIQDSASNTSSSSKDKRSYKLSHTVPAETWEKAIAAVEQQGMSLRTAAKMYGVHFAALHRRVKKRTQGGQTNGNDAYFDPNDEAGIMRVVVAHAELGVLMTFDELMRLVEAVALRKLPDISVESARKLLTRFESRNAQSIRHIIDDWPPPQLSTNAYPSAKPYLEHPGFSFGPTSTNTGGAATAAATPTTLFVPPIRLAPNIVDFRNNSKSPAVRLIDTMRTMDIDTRPSLPSSHHVGCVVTHPETTRLYPSREVCIDEGVDLRK